MTEQSKTGVEALVARLKEIRAADFMTRNIVTAKNDMKLAELATIMSKARISGLPVADGSGKMIGVITATDLFNLMSMIMDGAVAEEGKTGLCNPSVKFAMSTSVRSISPETTLYEIIGLVSAKKIHTLPVTEGDKLVGIVGRHDIFKLFYNEIKNLEE